MPAALIAMYALAVVSLVDDSLPEPMHEVRLVAGDCSALPSARQPPFDGLAAVCPISASANRYKP